MANNIQSYVNINDNGTIFKVMVTGSTYFFHQQPFTRAEFRNKVQAPAPNSDGSCPVPIKLIGGRTAIFMTNCGSNNTTRPFAPDGLSNVYSIRRRWDIRGFQLTGDHSIDGKASHLQRLYEAGKNQLSLWEDHISVVTEDLTYTDLQTLQAVNFTGITSTTLGMYGPAVGAVSVLESSIGSGNTAFNNTALAPLLDNHSTVIIDAGNEAQEIISVASVNYANGNITLAAPTANDHSGTAYIQPYFPNLIISDFKPEVSRSFPNPDGSTTNRQVWTCTIENRIDNAGDANI
jgi:hypothetical protein